MRLYNDPTTGTPRRLEWVDFVRRRKDGYVLYLWDQRNAIMLSLLDADMNKYQTRILVAMTTLYMQLGDGSVWKDLVLLYILVRIDAKTYVDALVGVIATGELKLWKHSQEHLRIQWQDRTRRAEVSTWICTVQSWRQEAKRSCGSWRGKWYVACVKPISKWTSCIMPIYFPRPGNDTEVRSRLIIIKGWVKSEGTIAWRRGTKDFTVQRCKAKATWTVGTTKECFRSWDANGTSSIYIPEGKECVQWQKNANLKKASAQAAEDKGSDELFRRELLLTQTGYDRSIHSAARRASDTINKKAGNRD